MSTNRAMITPGRNLLDFSLGIPLAIKQKVTIATGNGKMFPAIYLGQTKYLAESIGERFFAPHILKEQDIPINDAVRVFVGKKEIGKFLLAVKRRDEKTVVLIKETNLPCAD